MTSSHPTASADRLRRDLLDARARTLDLVSGLGPERLMGPRLGTVNPLLWEIGHLAWFQENWVVRHLNREPPARPDADALYDSMAVPHHTRWDLPLPSLDGTLAYMAAVLDRVLGFLDADPVPPGLAYFLRLVIFHEDMHDEAFTYTRQTLAYPAPRLRLAPEGASLPRGGEPAARRDRGAEAGGLEGDVEVPGGRFALGATPDGEPFVFDNEKWAHPVAVAPFRMARAPVTNAGFAAFVEDGGYRRPELWSPGGRGWLESARADHPVYWRRGGTGGWERREFDAWVPLGDAEPVIHVNAFEAEAYCAWAGRRLPTEAEWERAATYDPAAPGGKRRFPWGADPPGPDRANLDGRRLGPVAVGAFGAGDSALGIRGLVGNVWEWTASAFLPYPGFVPDPYQDYSEPWMDGRHRVLRGGGWATRGRLLRNTWRNFYLPERNDVPAGFRTCAR